jgi:Fe-Mn family superoxide dismutase
MGIRIFHFSQTFDQEDTMPFEMPALPYAFDALEPVIDARTVEIHYTKHHATHLKNFNATLEKYPDFFKSTPEAVIANLSKVPEDVRMAVKNNGGGFINHALYWSVMGPQKGGEPKDKLGAAIQKTFGDFSAFKAEFEKAGLTRFGSGYAWLSRKSDGSLLVHSTPNQDSPLTEGLYPIIVADVWEHAYYLNYLNRRADYLAAWWALVNWDEAENRFVNGK